MVHGFNQSSQQKPEIKMKHCKLVLKGTENTRQNEGGLSDFLDPVGPDSRTINVPYSARGEEINSEIIRLPPQFQRQG